MNRVLGFIVVSIALAVLVATADVTTVLLLQPPGQDSFPVALSTGIANAPESMVASLCLAYVLTAGMAIAAAALAAASAARRKLRPPAC